MNLKHISLVSVPVTDQDKAKDFYTEMLSFTVKVDVVMDAATAGSAGAAEQPGGGRAVGALVRGRRPGRQQLAHHPGA